MKSKDSHKTKKEIQETKELAECIIDTIHEPLIVLDADLRVVSASLSFYKTFKVNPKETEGQFIYALGNHQWDIPKLHDLLENILPKKTAFNKFEVEHEFIGIGKRTMLLNARQIQRSSKKSRIILLAIQDITERKLAEQKAQETREFAESIIDTIHEPLIVLDADLKVISAGLSFYETFKVNPEDTVGHFIYELGDHQWDIPKLRRLFDDILVQGTPFNKFEVEHEFIGIGKRTVLLNARQVLGSSEKSRIILLAFEEIVERFEAQLTKPKSIFNTMVSHELRTPLTSLRQSISLLAKGKIGTLHKEQQKFLDIAERNLDRLVSLINEILDFQKHIW